MYAYTGGMTTTRQETQPDTESRDHATLAAWSAATGGYRGVTP